MSEDFPSLLRRREPTFKAAIRVGKSVSMAQMAAETIRKGGSVFVISKGEAGELRCERVVGVPGFSDGRQLTDG